MILIRILLNTSLRRLDWRNLKIVETYLSINIEIPQCKAILDDQLQLSCHLPGANGTPSPPSDGRLWVRAIPGVTLGCEPTVANILGSWGD